MTRTLRVRLVADRPRAWLDERPVLDEGLGEFTPTVGSPGLSGFDSPRRPRTLPVVPRGSGANGWPARARGVVVRDGPVPLDRRARRIHRRPPAVLPRG